MYILHDLDTLRFSNMATSRETRSAIFKLLGQIDHNIKKVEAKNAEIDGKEKVTDQESEEEYSPFSQHMQAKSLYRSRRGSHFYGKEYEIWVDFGPVGSTEKKNGGPIVSKF